MKTITKESGPDYLLEELLVCKSKEDFILVFFMFWTDSVTISDYEFQKVIANPAINKWFLTELKKEENAFFAFIARYPHMDSKDKDVLYIKYLYKLMSIFPKPLLIEAKKRPHPSPPQKGGSLKRNFSFINQN